jgi:Protein of unknown function (DUF3147)
MGIGVYATKFIVGGILVCLFALVAEVYSPKRFAGLFSASPAVLTAGLTVTLVSSSVVVATRQAQGAIAGALGLVAYCLVAGPAMRRWDVLRGAVVAILAWAVVALLAYGVLAMVVGR